LNLKENLLFKVYFFDAQKDDYSPEAKCKNKYTLISARLGSYLSKQSQALPLRAKLRYTYVVMMAGFNISIGHNYFTGFIYVLYKNR
jgi:hypothetical protein